MSVLYALVGILFIAFIFEYDSRIGAMLLIIAVLGIWLTSKAKGIF